MIEQLEKPIYLSVAQLYCLHLARHYRLLRSSTGWWCKDHPRWDVTEPVLILAPSTVKSLWKMGLLEGKPDKHILGSPIFVYDAQLWANEQAIALLEEITIDTGTYFDVETDRLIYRVHSFVGKSVAIN